MVPTAAFASGERSQVTASTLRERLCGGLDGSLQKSAIKSWEKKKKDPMQLCPKGCSICRASVCTSHWSRCGRPFMSDSYWTKPKPWRDDAFGEKHRSTGRHSRGQGTITMWHSHHWWRRTLSFHLLFSLIPSEGHSVTLILPEDPEASCEGAVCGALSLDRHGTRFFVAAVD